MLMAPMSCSMSSAAMVSALIRDSANATSSFRLLHFKEMHTMTFNNNNYYWFMVSVCPSSFGCTCEVAEQERRLRFDFSFSRA